MAETMTLQEVDTALTRIQRQMTDLVRSPSQLKIELSHIISVCEKQLHSAPDVGSIGIGIGLGGIGLLIGGPLGAFIGAAIGFSIASPEQDWKNQLTRATNILWRIEQQIAATQTTPVTTAPKQVVIRGAGFCKKCSSSRVASDGLCYWCIFNKPLPIRGVSNAGIDTFIRTMLQWPDLLENLEYASELKKEIDQELQTILLEAKPYAQQINEDRERRLYLHDKYRETGNWDSVEAAKCTGAWIHVNELLIEWCDKWMPRVCNNYARLFTISQVVHEVIVSCAKVDTGDIRRQEILLREIRSTLEQVTRDEILRHLKTEASKETNEWLSWSDSSSIIDFAISVHFGGDRWLKAPKVLLLWQQWLQARAKQDMGQFQAQAAESAIKILNHFRLNANMINSLTAIIERRIPLWRDLILQEKYDGANSIVSRLKQDIMVAVMEWERREKITPILLKQIQTDITSALDNAFCNHTSIHRDDLALLLVPDIADTIIKKCLFM